MSASNVWFITGASTGFGREMTEVALASGHKVVATLRKPELLHELEAKYPDTLLSLRLDVTVASEIDDAFKKAKERFGRIDVVFNNAGVSVAGEVESVPEEEARSAFEVLFWGAARVSRVAMEYFRQNEPIGGRLFQLSSNLGVKAKPGTGWYSAAKFALEGLSEALAEEVNPAWNIGVCLVEPGPFRTEIGRNIDLDESRTHPAYRNSNTASRSFVTRVAQSNTLFDGDAKKAASVFLKLADLPLAEFPLRLPLHRMAVRVIQAKGESLIASAKKWERSSSGLGRHTAEAALAAGHKVVATLRKPEVLKNLVARYPQTLLTIKLDVTNTDDVDAAFAQAKAHFGRIDVVMNNAGYALVGEVEATSEKDAREEFEVLFWGAAKVTKVALQYFRENKPSGGRLLQMGSEFGILATPGAAYYSAAKFALSGLTESLSRELDPAWNIRVTIIEAGPFVTDIGRNTELLPVHPAYTNPELGGNKFRKWAVEQIVDGSPEKAAQIFIRLANLPVDEAPLRFPIHREAVESERIKARELLETAKKWESWSNNIYIDVKN
ncbi:hypothetical protein CVT24_010184 [Panaeolus cyanescens]|uniref:NAD(P)-binding protein n=1 Tax=Panaeolus cyanescens TaxID=181874 RepID=A0A409YPV9_9AGAR|nr:hypothetical protein CVT24_010184 [Panaeolus cyanescens]